MVHCKNKLILCHLVILVFFSAWTLKDWMLIAGLVSFPSYPPNFIDIHADNNFIGQDSVHSCFYHTLFGTAAIVQCVPKGLSSILYNIVAWIEFLFFCRIYYFFSYYQLDERFE